MILVISLMLTSTFLACDELYQIGAAYSGVDKHNPMTDILNVSG